LPWKTGTILVSFALTWMMMMIWSIL
jgi:hypothetical protein